MEQYWLWPRIRSTGPIWHRRTTGEPAFQTSFSQAYVLFRTSTAPRCLSLGSVRIWRQLRRSSAGEHCQYLSDKPQLRSNTDVFALELLLNSQAWLVHSLQSGSSYGTGYPGASTQSTQQPQGYDTSNSSYPAADQQQGYSAGQTDYTSSQQVLLHIAVSGQQCSLRLALVYAERQLDMRMHL